MYIDDRETHLYDINEVAKILGISKHTLNAWYTYETKLLQIGDTINTYLPQPTRYNKAPGKPRVWTKQDVEYLVEYRDILQRGSRGKFGKLTNPKNKNYIYGRNKNE